MAGAAIEKHGGYAKQTRRRYSDKRTREGKQLSAIMDGIIQDLGGQDSLTASQRLILSGISSKLILLNQISAYCDKQRSLLDQDGQVLACLKQTFLTYWDSLRRDLEALFGFDRRKQKVSRYKAALEALGGGDDD